MSIVINAEKFNGPALRAGLAFWLLSFLCFICVLFFLPVMHGMKGPLFPLIPAVISC